MTRVAIVVEGPTETDFVKNVLRPHLSEREVYPIPISLDGNIRLERLAPRMADLLYSHDWVTSLVDFYGFKRRNAAGPDELQNRIDDAVRQRMPPNQDSSHAFAYVQQYEFEALLFSDAGAFSILPGISSEQVALLRAIQNQFMTPRRHQRSAGHRPRQADCQCNTPL